MADWDDLDERAPHPVVDPHWIQLREGALLPALYMPPAMGGRHPVWLRAMAALLIGIFLLATALGICLTYGPPHWPF